MKVMVTGGAGFIGSHTVDLLVERGIGVSVVDDLSTGSIRNLNPQASFHKIDIRSDEINGIIGHEKPDCLIHLAAQPSVPQSVLDPKRDMEINIYGTLNLLESCRRHSVKKVIFASSAAVYGEPRYIPLDENHGLAPLSPYGLAKLTVEKYLRIYSDLYGLDFTALRFANVYGPRQDAKGEGGVVAIFSDKLASGERPVIFGDGEQTRDFIYVGDVAEALFASLTKGSRQVLNISSGIGTTINMLFTIMKDSLDLDIEPVYGKAREGDIRDSVLDNNRARHALGWLPGTRIAEGIRRTLDYYASNV